MKRFTTLSCMVILCGCGGDDAQVTVDATWLVRCDEQTGCIGYDVRRVSGPNGTNGTNVSCSIEKRGSNRAVYANVEAIDDSYGLRLRDVVVTPAGALSGSTCQVRVREDGNSYVGTCSIASPSEEAPCQISGLSVNGDSVRGAILCRKIPLEADANEFREVTSPSDPNEAFAFTFEHCSVQ